MNTYAAYHVMWGKTDPSGKAVPLVVGGVVIGVGAVEAAAAAAGLSVAACMATPSCREAAAEIAREGMEKLLEAAQRVKDGVASAADKALVAARKAACKSAHAAYKTAEKACRSCKNHNRISSDLKACAFCTTQAACWASVGSGRAAYLGMRCDYFLSNSIARGSALAEKGHISAMTDAFSNAAACGKCAAYRCGKCKDKVKDKVDKVLDTLNPYNWF